MSAGPSVYVTGIGIYTSIGCNREDFWNSLVAGKSGIRRIRSFYPEGLRSQIASEVVEFDPGRHLEPKKSRKMVRASQMAVCAAIDAVMDAGLDLEKEDPLRTGCIIGSGAGGAPMVEEQVLEFHNNGPGKVNPMTVPMAITNMPTCNAAMILDVHGPNFGVAGACTTGTHAIGLAFSMLREGRADIMIAGGSESSMTAFTVDCYDVMGALSRSNDDPPRASRPFDLHRNGFVIAEGAAVLILENEAHARKRGAVPLARLRGFGLTADAYSIVAPEPGGRWATAAMEAAMKDASLPPESIGYINAHGTSTRLNDKIETLAIKNAMKSDRVPVSSIKSMIGHALGAAGAIEAAATVLTLYHGILPPTINYETPDPECDLDCVPNTAREVKIEAALSNSFGFGGQNGTLAFSR